ncbi:hypothetical protein O6H91_03G134700 [Diphasiastrum complanatum]|uniref:Uncharacterized protein n=1 Tax=Diphasiastrum complanatum TaxID=34168 RepID=A0ACC2EC17_DIPCM|nr:hypothetical protein O6H91_03G134700 [Diphasiastrum complanatum]
MWKLHTGKGEEDDPRLSTLNDHVGRQVWYYDPQAGTPEERAEVEAARAWFTEHRFEQPQSGDVLLRLQYLRENPLPSLPPMVRVERYQDITEECVRNTLRRAIRFYGTLQAREGQWPEDHCGPLFLMPGMVITLYATGQLNSILSKAHCQEIRRYIYNHQNKDGGWGLNMEGQSVMFTTVLNYVTLRLIGEELNKNGKSESLEKAHKWIQDHGGATQVPTWGKFWLSVLGVYDWAGINPLPPEAWLLPQSSSSHPGWAIPVLYRWIFCPMSYVYGCRFSNKLSTTIQALRNELYTISYEQINWNQARSLGAKEEPVPRTFREDIIFSIFHNVFEPLLLRWPGSKLRKKALDTTMKLIHYEDSATQYICFNPVSKSLNMLCCWLEDPDSDAFQKHLPRVVDYLWLSEDGMKMQAYNGSQVWETALSIQALLSTELFEDCSSTLKKAKSYIEKTQIREHYPDGFVHWNRHITKGTWPFSTRDQGWPTFDCAAEALKALLGLSKALSTINEEPLSVEHMNDCVDALISFQNLNGSFSPYDTTAGTHGLKLGKKAETFEEVTNYWTSVECTSSVIQALAAFRRVHPNYKPKEIESCIQRARHFIEKLQRPDGSWYGIWATCFTYGTKFAMMGLLASGAKYESSIAVQRGCEFLLSKQLSSGGWGESFESSQTMVYTNLEGGRAHVVHTALSLLALIAAGQAQRDVVPLHKAATILINSQMDNGDYPQEENIGAVYGQYRLNYGSYRCIFPIWALAEYKKQCCSE